MKKRIAHILLICSTYDAFILEEDGRIDEQIFNEYVSLNLRYPPQFIQANSRQEAMELLESENIDLIISMFDTGEVDTFELSKDLKEVYPEIPIVVLTPFSREVSLKLTQTDLGSIDYVFSWLGNSDLLLAVVKLIEDRMNVEHDVFEVGVQAILLVEDNVRFYSSYLPNIYKIIFKQSKEFMLEGLNEHQKMLRMRGRPKIFMARTYEEAEAFYEKYKKHLLGVISDVSYPRADKMDKTAGFSLCEKVKFDDPFMPFLLQSSEESNADKANDLNVGFIHKHSKTLSMELRAYIMEHFAFGDFVFRKPQSHKELSRASDLQALQHKIFEIPDDSLEYHIKRNHFSKWLNARAFFQIADIFRYLRRQDFDDLDDIRRFMYDTISTFRLSKVRGVIAEFYRDRFDEYFIFSRIGEGSLGGKARGLAFIDSMIKRNNLLDKYPDVVITIPRTVVLTTDVFDEFMEENDLYSLALSDIPDEQIMQAFIKARLPFRIHEDLIAFISVVRNPIAVRSSSLLEDSHYQPFAGIYSTYMIPRLDDERLMIEQLSYAIKGVYASVFFKDSKAYMTATSNVIDEEKMAVVLQEVCGAANGDHFYPTLSGVARSVNFYPVAPEKPEEGIANIAFGLGKYIVDGGLTLRFSPKYPKKILQLSSPDMAMRETQREFYSLDINKDAFKPSTDDGVNIARQRIKHAAKDPNFKAVASTFDYNSNMLRDGLHDTGKHLVTFSQILNYEVFPLAPILQDLLEIGQREMNNPIEIEFAANLNVPAGHPKVFNFLQIRPIVENREGISLKLEDIDKEETVIVSDHALGNGVIEDVHHFLYVKPESFDPAKSPEIAGKIEKINTQFLEKGQNYILVGPGRWGSSDPWLGIPVKWSQISAARLIVESGLENYRIDPSQGTHFFQNLTSFQVGYFTLNPFINDGFYDLNYLKNHEAEYEDEFIRLLAFDSPLKIMIDGKKNKGLVLKA